jgi:hypothetical protein
MKHGSTQPDRVTFSGKMGAERFFGGSEFPPAPDWKTCRPAS